MKLKFFKRIFSVLLCAALIVGVFSACSGSGVIDFIYPFSADVRSYDPQVAGTYDEFLIIENTFEGLIRIDDDGTVKKGVAESWEISDDKKIYTFKLKKGIKWNINTDKYESGENKGEFKDERLKLLGYEFNPDITAHDFVFALRRAASPETKCPLFSNISCIKNAVNVNSKKMDKSKLGVTAVDDYTLKIELDFPDESFMQTLTSSVAMPCNEEFWTATKGKYGLSTKYTLFNGQFYVSQILETSYLLKKNELYLGEFPTEASELTLKIVSDEEEKEIVDKLKSGYYDAAFISANDSEKASLEKEGITLTPYNDTTWAFVFNKNDAVFQSKTMRNAFCLGFSRIKGEEGEHFFDATNVVPSSCTIGANNSNSAVKKTAKAQNQNKSKELWRKGLSIIDSDDIEITILVPAAMENEAKALIQGVQSGLGTITKSKDGDAVTFTLKVKTAEEDEFNSLIATGEYQIALYPFKSTSNSAVAFLRGVCDSSVAGFDKKKVTKYLNEAEKVNDLKSKADNIRKAENEIINSYTLCPMLFETSYYAQASGVSNVQFHVGTGRVSFVNAKRTK